MRSVSRRIDRINAIFDEPNLVANAGLLLVATLVARLDLESPINATVRLGGRVGGALPGRKVLTFVHTMVAGGSHIDHADVLRSGATSSVLGHRVMAPSTLGTFFRAFTFGHVRQLDAVLAEALRRGWSLGAGPGVSQMVMDLDSTICEVCGKTQAFEPDRTTHRVRGTNGSPAWIGRAIPLTPSRAPRTLPSALPCVIPERVRPHRCWWGLTHYQNTQPEGRVSAGLLRDASECRAPS